MSSENLDQPREVFRQNLRHLRQKQGLTQIELSEMCQYEGSYLGKLERGDADPSLEAILRIAEALQVEVEDLLLPNKPAQDDTSEDLPDQSPKDPQYPHSITQIEYELQADEQARTEELLIKDRNRFQILFAQAPVALLVMDFDGYMLQLNHRAERLFNIQPIQPGKTHLNELLHPDYRDSFHQFLNRFETGEDRVQQDFEFTNPDHREWAGRLFARRIREPRRGHLLYGALIPETEDE